MVMVTGHRSQVGFVDHKRSFNFCLSPKLLPNMGNDCQRAWNQTLKFSFQNGFHRRRMSRNWNFGSWYLGMESLLTTLTWLFQMFSKMAMPGLGFIFYAGIPLSFEIFSNHPAYSRPLVYLVPKSNLSRNSNFQQNCWKRVHSNAVSKSFGEQTMFYMWFLLGKEFLSDIYWWALRLKINLKGGIVSWIKHRPFR